MPFLKRLIIKINQHLPKPTLPSPISIAFNINTTNNSIFHVANELSLDYPSEKSSSKYNSVTIFKDELKRLSKKQPQNINPRESLDVKSSVSKYSQSQVSSFTREESFKNHVNGDNKATKYSLELTSSIKPVKEPSSRSGRFRNACLSLIQPRTPFNKKSPPDNSYRLSKISEYETSDKTHEVPKNFYLRDIVIPNYRLGMAGPPPLYRYSNASQPPF